MQHLAVVTRTILWAAMLFVPAMRAHAQTAVLEGTVLVDGTDRPLANANVMLTDLRLSARTDSAGNFTIPGVAPGTHQFQIRLAGYEQYTAMLMFKASQKFEADFLMKQSATGLATVEVKDKASSPYATRLAEFDKRRRTSGGGNYITGDVFDKEQGRKLSEILNAKIPGAHTHCSGSECYLYSARAAITFRQNGGPCYAMIVVNGVIVFNGGLGTRDPKRPSLQGQPLFDINSINTLDVIAVEYHSTASVPTEYNATGNMCGALIIWTKGG